MECDRREGGCVHAVLRGRKGDETEDLVTVTRALNLDSQDPSSDRVLP